jgi:hypothetical protein
MGEMSFGFTVGLILGLSFGFSSGMVLERSHWKAVTINRGISQYCPDTGEFAWKGECK